MTMNKDKWLAAIIAGIAMGIPSALPFFGNCCILPAAVLAGLIAVFFYTRRTEDPIQSIDGVTLGAIAGLVGGLLCALESFIFKSGIDRLNAYDLQGLKLNAQGHLMQLIGSAFWSSLWLFAFLVPAVFGGIIGAQFFRKPATNNTSPQPPQ